MSGYGGNARNSRGVLGGIIFFIVLLLILYYVYTFLYSSNSTASSVNIIPTFVLDQSALKGGVVRCDAAKPLGAGTSTPATGGSSPNESAVAQIPAATGLSSGGQYSVMLWVSVFGTTPSTSGLSTLNILDITSASKTLLYIGIKPLNGTLVIRQSTTDPNDGMATTYVANQTAGSPVVGSDKCDILNGIEYQRWVLLGVVANGRTLDVYVDGKLSRSCVYLALNDLGVSNGKGTITVGRQNATSGTINGVFSTTDYYNYALTPDSIWAIYQAGPSTSSASIFGNLFTTNIDLSMGYASS